VTSLPIHLLLNTIIADVGICVTIRSVPVFIVAGTMVVKSVVAFWFVKHLKRTFQEDRLFNSLGDLILFGSTQYGKQFWGNGSRLHQKRKDYIKFISLFGTIDIVHWVIWLGTALVVFILASVKLAFFFRIYGITLETPLESSMVEEPFSTPDVLLINLPQLGMSIWYKPPPVQIL